MSLITSFFRKLYLLLGIIKIEKDIRVIQDVVQWTLYSNVLNLSGASKAPPKTISYILVKKNTH